MRGRGDPALVGGKRPQHGGPSAAAARVSLLNLGGGAHGATLPADAQPADLRRLVFQFYMGPQREELEALVSRLPADRQIAWKQRMKNKDRLAMRQEVGAAAGRRD